MLKLIANNQTIRTDEFEVKDESRHFSFRKDIVYYWSDKCSEEVVLDRLVFIEHDLTLYQFHEN